jgi:hypothetical protein
VVLWLLILLRRILSIGRLLLVLRRRGVGSLRLVRRLGWRVRAGSLRRVLTLWVLILWGILGIGLRSSLRLDERLLLLNLLLLLGFHGDGLSSNSLVIKQESAVIAAREEAVQSPGKGCDKEKPIY